MAVLVAALCCLENEMLPRWFRWLACGAVLCFALSWLTWRKDPEPRRHTGELSFPRSTRLCLLSLAAGLLACGIVGWDCVAVTAGPACALVFVAWKGRIDPWIPHAREIDSLLRSPKLAVPVTFFVCGILITLFGVALLRFSVR
jgi:hypothetical protein